MLILKNAYLGTITFENNILKNTNFEHCHFSHLIFNSNIDFADCNFRNSKGRAITINSIGTAWNLRKCNFDNMEVEEVNGNIIGKLIIAWNGAHIGKIKYENIWERGFYNIYHLK